MSELPTVSIVTPSYNQAQFLEATICSVLGQDYPQIEYMICDGGSTDGSVDIIHRYADRLTYWVSEKDGGQSNAINKGWRRATGGIWSYLNSDDMLEPGAVRAVVQAFCAHPQAAIAHGDWVYVDVDGREIEQQRGAPCDFERLLRDGQIKYVAQPASFYRSHLVRRLGFLDESLHISMDYDLLLRLARVGDMVYIPRVLARFRLHASAKSTTLADRHWQETLEVQARHGGGRVSPRLRMRYLRYRLLRAMPHPVQMAFRRLRHSRNDRLLLEAD